MNYKEVQLTIKRKNQYPQIIQTNIFCNIMGLLDAELKHEAETETYQLDNRKKKFKFRADLNLLLNS